MVCIVDRLMDDTFLEHLTYYSTKINVLFIAPVIPITIIYTKSEAKLVQNRHVIIIVTHHEDVFSRNFGMIIILQKKKKMLEY